MKKLESDLIGPNGMKPYRSNSRTLKLPALGSSSNDHQMPTLSIVNGFCVRVSREQQHIMLERPCTVEEKMLTQAGIEPATLSTLDWRSNQLSYCAVGRVWVINPYHYEDG